MFVGEGEVLARLGRHEEAAAGQVNGWRIGRKTAVSPHPPEKDTIALRGKGKRPQRRAKTALEQDISFLSPGRMISLPPPKGE